MNWNAYQVIFRLRAPLHVGRGKVGNVQLTRPYVTGRALWGALTMRLTRDDPNRKMPATDSARYQQVGKQVNEQLAYTYFYPATSEGDGYQVALPWENESLFRRRFLSSYNSTALIYPHNSAAEGTLHEVEFLSPFTLDDGKPVFLIGYIFERNGCQLAWRKACERIQLGGERGYGWGVLELVTLNKVEEAKKLFNDKASWNGSTDRPQITSECLLAHTRADQIDATGDIEPVVGREWRSQNQQHRFAGQHLEFNGVCFTPGSRLSEVKTFVIGEFGIWQAT